MSDKPTPEQVLAEIVKLRAIKESVRHFTIFDDNNWTAIEATCPSEEWQTLVEA